MAVYVSPGVYARIIDLSLYVPALSSTIMGMVGTATKGPVNEAVFISNISALTSIFGDLHPDHLALYAAADYLRQGRQLYYVRVNSATSAKAATPYMLGDVTPARMKGSVAGPYTFNDAYGAGLIGTNTAATVTVTSSNKNLLVSVNGGPAVAVVLSEGVGIAKAAIVAEIDAALDSVGGGSVVGSSYRDGTGSATAVAIQTTDVGATTRLDLLSTTNNAYTLLGLTTGTYYGANGNRGFKFRLRNVTADTVTVATGEFDWGTLTAAEVATALNDEFTTDSVALEAVVVDNHVWVQATTLGSVREVRFENPSTDPWDESAAAILGLTKDTYYRGRGAAPAANTMRAVAANTGDWGNNLKIIVSTGTVPDTFKLSIFNGTRIEEVFNNLVGNPADASTVTGTQYVLDAVNGISRLITFEDLITDTGYPANGTYLFSGGDDGLAGLGDEDFIGTTSGSTRTGLQLFSNPEDIDVNLVAVPGITSAAVIEGLITLCETRGDCMCLIDPPLGMEAQQLVDWHNGSGVYSDHDAFNSRYAALQSSWVKQYDAFNSRYVWVPPCGQTAAIYAYTDRVSELWFAPAGLNRGRLLNVTDIWFSPSLGERDLMYGDGNAVNPIVKFRQDGIVLYGQRTLQRKPTALDRVGVMRLVVYLLKSLSTALKYTVFEPNDEVTWRTVKAFVEPYLETVKSRRGLYDYLVVCDETTNTPDRIDQGIMTVNVLIKPVKAAEFIELNLVVTNTGVALEGVTF